jgi:signal transduction histidine kinase
LGEEAGCLRADAAQIQQVIMNLALNARDAMPDGGRITISIENVALVEERRLEIPPGDYVRLRVSDTGHGMDANTMDHLFEPFFTTKGLANGTGLGLSIVYGIVKQWGGISRSRVKSVRGRRSQFTCRVFSSLLRTAKLVQRKTAYTDRRQSSWSRMRPRYANLSE